MARRIVSVALRWALVVLLLGLGQLGRSSLRLNDYTTCCTMLASPDDLLECQKEWSFQERSHDILFVTFMSKEIVQYSSLYLFYNKYYFDTYGYNLMVLDELSGNDYFPSDRRWNKIQALRNGIDSWGKNYKYIVYIDADIIFPNPLIDIADHITAAYAENPDIHVIMSEDLLDFGNSGVIIVENHPWSVGFLSRWVELKDSQNTFCDQHVLNRLSLELEKNNSLQHVQLLPFPKINSEFPAIQTLSTNSTPLLIHFLGEYSEVRESIGRNLTERLCREVRAVQKSHTNNHEAIRIDNKEFLSHFPVPTRKELAQMKFRALRNRLNRLLLEYDDSFAAADMTAASQFLDSLKHFCEFQQAMTPQVLQRPPKRIVAPWDSHSQQTNCPDYLRRFHEILGNSLHFHYMELTKPRYQQAGYEVFFKKMKTLLSFYDVRVSLRVLNTTLSSSSLAEQRRQVDEEIAFLGDTVDQLLSMSDNPLLLQGLRENRGEEGEKERVLLFLRLFVLEKRVALSLPLLEDLHRRVEENDGDDTKSIDSLLKDAKDREQVVLSDLSGLVQLIQRNLIDGSAELADYYQLLLQEQIFRYIQSSSRLSFYYSLAGSWQESLEWCEIARNNVQLLLDSYRGEDRLIVNLAREVYFRCAEVSERASSVSSERDLSMAREFVQEGESFRYHAGRLGHVQRKSRTAGSPRV